MSKGSIFIDLQIHRMVHLKEESHYNYNYYSHGNQGIKLLQICDEYSETYDYYIVEGDNKIFLGSSDETNGDDILNLMTMYT